MPKKMGQIFNCAGARPQSVWTERQGKDSDGRLVQWLLHITWGRLNAQRISCGQAGSSASPLAVRILPVANSICSHGTRPLTVAAGSLVQEVRTSGLICECPCGSRLTAFSPSFVATPTHIPLSRFALDQDFALWPEWILILNQHFHLLRRRESDHFDPHCTPQTWKY